MSALLVMEAAHSVILARLRKLNDKAATAARKGDAPHHDLLLWQDRAGYLADEHRVACEAVAELVRSAASTLAACDDNAWRTDTTRMDACLESMRAAIAKF